MAEDEICDPARAMSGVSKINTEKISYKPKIYKQTITPQPLTEEFKNENNWNSENIGMQMKKPPSTPTHQQDSLIVD
jgi:hypothetical protein